MDNAECWSSKQNSVTVCPSFWQNACSPQSCKKIQMAGEFWEVNAAVITCHVAWHASQFGNSKDVSRRSQWPRGLRRRSAAARLPRLWVHIQPGAWMSVSCESCVLWGIDLIDELISRPEEPYRLWCVVVCDLETLWMRRPWPALGRSATKKKSFRPDMSTSLR